FLRRQHGAAAFVERMSDCEFGAGRDPAHRRVQARGRERLARDDGDAEKPAVTFEAQPPHGCKIALTRSPREMMPAKFLFAESRQSRKHDKTANIPQGRRAKFTVRIDC